MAEVILMPRLSDTMTEGVIVEWHKKVGDPVKKGDLLAEVETDKATMELESYKDGTLLHIGTDKGGKLQVNDLLAIIGNKGEDISGLLKQNGGNAAKTEQKPEPAQQQKPEPAQKDSSSKPQAAAATPAVNISKMEEVILMPRLSDTMTEGVIASWHKKVGDDVKKGDVLADIETDKATMELESYKTGKLLYVGAKEGEKILVNDLLAIIGGDNVDVQKIVAAAKSSGGQTAPQQETDKEVRTPAESNAEQLAVESRSKDATPKGEPAQQGNGKQDIDGRVKASPLAKKLAAEKGIDIREVLAKKGNGNFAYLDNEGEAEKVLVKELTQTLYSVADDASLSIHFNSEYVKEYRLIGYDNKLKALADSVMEVEGGEVGSGHSTMVLLEIKPSMKISGGFQFPNAMPVSRNNIGDVTISYKHPSDTTRIMAKFGVPYNYTEFHELPPCYRFASSVAMFGTLLKDSPFAKQMTWNETIIAANESYDHSDPVQKEFITIVEKAKKIYSKGRRKRSLN